MTAAPDPVVGGVGRPYLRPNTDREVTMLRKLGRGSARRAFIIVASSAAVTFPLPLLSPGAGAASVPVSQASTSARGVTATTINVVFPVANLDALASTYGF